MTRDEKIKALKDERAKILELAISEKRELTMDEASRVDDIYREIATLRATQAHEGDIDEEKRGEVEAPTATLIQVLRDIGKSGNAREATKATIARGEKQMKDAGIVRSGEIAIPMDLLVQRSALTVGGTNKATVSTDVQNILEPLYGGFVFAKAGATILTGLRGNISFPRYSGTSSTWAGETDSATNGEGTISQVEFSPKRLTTVVEVSGQLLTQDDAGVEAMLQREIIQSIQAKLEATALGSQDTDSGKRPKGLFNGTVDNKGSATYARTLDMEASVASQNALVGNLSYITTPKGAKILRSTPKGKAEVSYIADEHNKLNGYPLLLSNGVAKNINSGEEGIIFANFSDFIIAQWGGMDIIRDVITKGGDGIVRFIISTYWDFGFIRPESVAIATIK